MTIRLKSGYNVRLGGWQLDGEFRAFTQTAVYFDGSAHLFDGVLDDGKAQAGAAQGARSRFVDAVEALEDARQILGRDADAGVSDQDVDLSVPGSHLDLDFTARPVELDGVIKQIDKDLLQPKLMANDRYVVQFFAQQPDALQARGGFHGADGGFERGADGDRVGRRRDSARLKFRKRQQVRGDVAEPGGLRKDDFDEAPVIPQVLETAVQQGFGVAPDGGERSSELMRDVSDKILAYAFQAFQLGDVVQNRERSSRRRPSQRPGQYLKRVRAGGRQSEPLFHALSSCEDGGHDLAQSGIAHQFGQRHARNHGQARAHRSSEGMVAERNAQVLVDSEHALHHAHENRFAAGALQFQALHQLAYARRGSLEGTRQKAQVVVSGGQLLLEHRRIEQAFHVGTDLRKAAGKRQRKKERQQAGCCQKQRRCQGKRTPQCIAVCGAVCGHVQNHGGEPNRQQKKAAPNVPAKNAPTHGNLVTV